MNHSSKFQAVRRLLLEEWDPVGVRDIAAAQDEYDQYVPAIVALLERHASEDEIARRLGDVATLEMGLSEVLERDLAVARSLARLQLT